MSKKQATEGETASNARINLPNGYSAELTTLTRATATIEKTKIKSVLLEVRVEGVIKIEWKERNHTKTLEEASKMVGKLTTTGHIDGIITHDNKLKTDEFYNVHEWASAARHVGGEKNSNSGDV